MDRQNRNTVFPITFRAAEIPMVAIPKEKHHEITIVTSIHPRIKQRKSYLALGCEKNTRNSLCTTLYLWNVEVHHHSFSYGTNSWNLWLFLSDLDDSSDIQDPMAALVVAFLV